VPKNIGFKGKTLRSRFNKVKNGVPDPTPWCTGHVEGGAQAPL